MVEIRFAVPQHTTTMPPVLQYRVMVPCVDIGGNLCPGDWSEWVDVPRVVLDVNGDAF